MESGWQWNGPPQGPFGPHMHPGMNPWFAQGGMGMPPGNWNPNFGNWMGPGPPPNWGQWNPGQAPFNPNQWPNNEQTPPAPVPPSRTISPPRAAEKLPNPEYDESNDPELVEFDNQFKTWEEQFLCWKRENRDHPDKQALITYEEQWNVWRDDLLQKRERLKKEKLDTVKVKTEQVDQSNQQSSHGPSQPTSPNWPQFSSPDKAPNMPGRPEGPPNMPGRPEEPPNMPSRPERPPNMPGRPERPNMPGRPEGPNMPGMPDGPSNMPGMPDGFPNMFGIPGRSPNMPGVRGLHSNMPGILGEPPNMPGMPGGPQNMQGGPNNMPDGPFNMSGSGPNMSDGLLGPAPNMPGEHLTMPGRPPMPNMPWNPDQRGPFPPNWNPGQNLGADEREKSAKRNRMEENQFTSSDFGNRQNYGQQGPPLPEPDLEFIQNEVPQNPWNNSQDTMMNKNQRSANLTETTMKNKGKDQIQGQESSTGPVESDFSFSSQDGCSLKGKLDDEDNWNMRGFQDDDMIPETPLENFQENRMFTPQRGFQGNRWNRGGRGGFQEHIENRGGGGFQEDGENRGRGGFQEDRENWGRGGFQEDRANRGKGGFQEDRVNRGRGGFQEDKVNRGRGGFQEDRVNRDRGSFQEDRENRGRGGFQENIENRGRGGFQENIENRGRGGFQEDKVNRGRGGFQEDRVNRDRGGFQENIENRGRGGFQEDRVNRGRGGFQEDRVNRGRGGFQEERGNRPERFQEDRESWPERFQNNRGRPEHFQDNNWNRAGDGFQEDSRNLDDFLGERRNAGRENFQETNEGNVDRFLEDRRNQSLVGSQEGSRGRGRGGFQENRWKQGQDEFHGNEGLGRADVPNMGPMQGPPGWYNDERANKDAQQNRNFAAGRQNIGQGPPKEKTLPKPTGGGAENRGRGFEGHSASSNLNEMGQLRGTANVLALFKQKASGQTSAIPGLDIEPSSAPSPPARTPIQMMKREQRKERYFGRKGDEEPDSSFDKRLDIGPIGVGNLEQERNFNNNTSWKPPEEWYDDEEEDHEERNSKRGFENGNAQSGRGKSFRPDHSDQYSRFGNPNQGPGNLRNPWPNVEGRNFQGPGNQAPKKPRSLMDMEIENPFETNRSKNGPRPNNFSRNPQPFKVPAPPPRKYEEPPPPGFECSAAIPLPDDTPTEIDETRDIVTIDDIISPPGRFMRPPKILIILRGLPGAGKSTIAKLIKNREIENGGTAPRILCLDDYFMVEVEKIVIDPENGRKTKMKAVEYEFEPELEEKYRGALLKSFKKQVDDQFFSFIIIDCVNSIRQHYEEIAFYARQNDFEVYIGEVDADIQTCYARNIHTRTMKDLQKINAQWQKTILGFISLDLTSYIQDANIQEVEMEVCDDKGKEPTTKRKGPSKIGDDDSGGEEEETFHMVKELMKSKWDTHGGSQEDKMNKLDGLKGAKKRLSFHHDDLNSPQSIDDWLQLSKEFARKRTAPGKKTVRWADIEERNKQCRDRDMGFIVGQTDWGRMTDPTLGRSALVQVRYIESRNSNGNS